MSSRHDVGLKSSKNEQFMNRFTQFYGIDVSKDNLDIVQLSACGQQVHSEQIANTLNSIHAWIATLAREGVFCVLEATGTYSAKVVHCLSQSGVAFSRVNPARSKFFMDVLGLNNKTDYLAAWSLAKMGLQLDLKPYRMPSPQRQQRAQLQQAIQAMHKQRQMLKNQLHALRQLPSVADAAQMAYRQTLTTVEAQIQMLEHQLEGLEDDEEFINLTKYISSVAGIGKKTAEAILIVTNDLQTFDTAGQLACFLGLTPKSHHSGPSVHRKGRISKHGPHYIRCLLYMCTRSAIRYNLACKTLYERLRKKGKPYKVAVIAVMHKLVKQLFACAKKQALFDNQYKQSITQV